MRPATTNAETGVLLRPTGPAIEDEEHALILDTHVVAVAKWPFLLFAFIACSRTERLRLGPQGLDYRWTNGHFRGGRTIALAEIESVSHYFVMVGDPEGNAPHTEHGLEIETLGKPLRCGQRPDRDEIIRLEEQVQQHLRVLNPSWVNRTWGGTEVLDRSRTLHEPPADCAIRCRREWDRTEFVSRFPTSWSAGLGLFLIGFFFMAMSCIWMVQIAGKSDWFLLSCLMTAALAGVGLLVLCVCLVLGRRRWIVRPGEVTSTASFLGFPWSQTSEVEWLDRIELRLAAPKTTSLWGMLPDIGFGSVERGFELALVDLNENDVAVLGPMTKGEARWMAGIVTDVLKDAFPKEGQSFARWSVSADPPAAGSKALVDRWLDEPVFS
jgi:hypothetical protein